MSKPRWLEEDNVDRNHSRESIESIELFDGDDNSIVLLTENHNEELQQIIDFASSSNANDTTNIQTAMAAPIHQRRRSQRILAMNGKRNHISALKHRRRSHLKKPVNSKQTNARSPVVLTENQPDLEWQSNLTKRKHSAAQNKQRSKTNLSASVWKYFTDIKPQIQSQPDSLELSTVEVGCIELGDGPSKSNAGEQSSKSKEIHFSAKCTICGERKQFQKGSVWNVKSHLEKVCFKFNLHPFS